MFLLLFARHIGTSSYNVPIETEGSINLQLGEKFLRTKHVRKKRIGTYS